MTKKKEKIRFPSFEELRKALGIIKKQKRNAGKKRGRKRPPSKRRK